MSDFFEPPPPAEPPPPRRPAPPWRHAPSGTLPGVIALELVMAQTERVAVCVTRLDAYPSGFELELVTLAAVESEGDQLDPMLFGGRHGPGSRRSADGGIPTDMLRFGVEFANRAKATNTAGRPGSIDAEPTGPVLSAGGGGGGGGNWRQSVWVWPLPPPGPLTFVCEWPAAGVALTRHQIDAQLVLDAASRSQAIFSDGGRSAASGRFHSYGPMSQARGSGER
jgi:hypothetical protein